MNYVDGFLLVVPKDKVEEYREMATQGMEVWMRHGALGYYECMGDDLDPNKNGEMEMPPEYRTSSFPEVVNLKENETVWFSFIFYKSKEHRDEVNANVMKDPDMDGSKWKDQPMPFDMSRMAMGGFVVKVGNSS